jgi:hypothetical protein
MAKIVTQFYTHFYNSRVGKIALVTMDNGEDYKKPTTLKITRNPPPSTKRRSPP